MSEVLSDAMDKMKICGAMDFCQFLRGKVAASILLVAWQDFIENYPANMSLRVPTNPSTYSDKGENL